MFELMEKEIVPVSADLPHTVLEPVKPKPTKCLVHLVLTPDTSLNSGRSGLYLQRRLLETGIQVFSVCFDTWNLSTKELHMPEKVFCKHHLMLPGFLHPSSPSLSLACKSVSLCISCAENALKRALSGS